jgi:hypothetical protein
MKLLNKTVKLLSITMLIVLASIGIGLGGGIPIQSSKKKEDFLEIKIELVDRDDDQTKLGEFEKN